MRARDTFRAAVRKAGGSVAASKRLRCSRSYVDMIAGGKRRPGLRLAFAIERAFRIPASAWLDVKP